MKKTLIILGMLSVVVSYGQEGRVGINTESPDATLEVAGMPTNTSVLDGIIAPRLTGNQLGAKSYTVNQTGALVYATKGADTLSGQVINVDTAGYYYFDGQVWQVFKTGDTDTTYTIGKGMSLGENNEISRTGFEEIIENGKTGWRLIGKDAGNYGNIGEYAVDASHSSSNSETRGATGNYSFASGFNSTASGNSSTAMGNSSIASGSNSTAMGITAIASGNSSFAVGISEVSGNHSVAINGNYAKTVVSSPRSFSVGQGNEITSTGNSNYTFGYNNKITSESSVFAFGQGNNITSGASYTIGSGNKILSPAGQYKNHVFGMDNVVNTGASTFAIGQANEINASSSYAFGANNIISGYGSVTIGYGVKATGHTNFALGSGITATSELPIVIGRNKNMLTITGGGNVGVDLGEKAATEKLEVGGAIKIATTGSECSADKVGTIKFENDNFYGCKSTGWILLNN